MKINFLQRQPELPANNAGMQCLSSGAVETQCYSSVLRNVYDEIYLLDFVKDEARVLYRAATFSCRQGKASRCQTCLPRQ